MAPKVGLHACYMRGTEYEWDVTGSISLAKKYGCDLFEIAIATIIDLTKEQRIEIKKHAENEGMTLTVNGGLDVSSDISCADESKRMKGIERSKRVLEAIHDVGGELYCGINYTAWLAKPEKLLTYDEKQKCLDYCYDSMKQILPVAENYNIDYCFEIVNRYEEFLLNTAKEGVEFAERTGSPKAKLLLDTFHMNIEEDNMCDAIEYAYAKGRLGHIHVGESNRRIPGLGRTNICWDEFFKTMKKINYDRNVIMEPFVRMGLQTSMNCCVWRDLTTNHEFAEFMNDVKSGVEYLKNGLK